MEELLYWIFVILIVTLIIGIAYWILWSIAHMHMLQGMGYPNPWMAWIPILRYFALADCLPMGPDDTIYGLHIPKDVFKFWYLIAYGIGFIPYVGSFIMLFLGIMCRGWCYYRIYAQLEMNDSGETELLGVVTGLFSPIAVVKYLFYKPKQADPYWYQQMQNHQDMHFNDNPYSMPNEYVSQGGVQPKTAMDFVAEDDSLSREVTADELLNESSGIDDSGVETAYNTYRDIVNNGFSYGNGEETNK